MGLLTILGDISTFSSSSVWLGSIASISIICYPSIELLLARFVYAGDGSTDLIYSMVLAPGKSYFLASNFSELLEISLSLSYSVA